MSGSAEILAAFRELSNSKQIDRAELHALFGFFVQTDQPPGAAVAIHIFLGQHRAQPKNALAGYRPHSGPGRSLNGPQT